MPSAFKHSNWASFVRQLNYYGFRKVRSSAAGSGECEFKHDLFQRGRPELVAQIRRPDPSPSVAHRLSPVDSAEELRQDLDDLRAQVSGLSSVIRELCGTILRLSEGESSGPSRAEASSSSCKRQKAEEETIDFEMLESLFEDVEAGAADSHPYGSVLSAAPSMVVPLTPLSYPTLLPANAAAYSISGC